MQHDFVYQAPAQRVVFGWDTTARVGEEIGRLGHGRALLLATPGRAEAARELADILGGRAAAIFAGAAMHTPVEVTETALKLVRETGADCLVALGGGSAIGLGKALALGTGLDQIVLPTTYAGSEATPILGQTEAGEKTTMRSPEVVPEVVVYDIAHTLSLPVAVSVASGMNAMAHAVEALYAEDRNPVTSLLAADGIRALAGALPAIAADPRDRDARAGALYGAWACGTCLGTVGMALHHRICHVLGGSFGLPHAETHAAILPHAAAFNEPAARAALAPAARALDAGTAAAGLFGLAERLGAPRALADLGMPEDGLDRAAALIAADPYRNPRPVTREAVRALLDDAWAGRRPSEV